MKKLNLAELAQNEITKGESQKVTAGGWCSSCACSYCYCGWDTQVSYRWDEVFFTMTFDRLN